MMSDLVCIRLLARILRRMRNVMLWRMWRMLLISSGSLMRVLNIHLWMVLLANMFAPGRVISEGCHALLLRRRSWKWR